MSLTGIAPPSRLSGLPELDQRQFNEWFQWLERLDVFLGSRDWKTRFVSGATHAVLPTDAYTLIVVDHASAATVTIDASTFASFRTGPCFAVLQYGADVAQVTIAPTGVDLHSAETLRTRKNDSMLLAWKLRDGEGLVTGDMELF